LWRVNTLVLVEVMMIVTVRCLVVSFTWLVAGATPSSGAGSVAGGTPSFGAEFWFAVFLVASLFRVICTGL
jgi:hypothetical protein